MPWDINYIGAVVMSSPVWKCYEVSRNNEKLAICVYVLHNDMMNDGSFLTADVRADPHITAHVYGALRLTCLCLYRPCCGMFLKRLSMLLG